MRLKIFTFALFFFFVADVGSGKDANYKLGLRRAQYLLSGSMPNDGEFAAVGDRDAYNKSVRRFIEHNNFYNTVLRYHQRVLGVGLPSDYIEELMADDIDGKLNKFASITCQRGQGNNSRFRCYWTSTANSTRSGGCPEAWEQAASVFWYPQIVAWVCPTIINACGSNLSRCFVRAADANEAKNSELGTTETFDSRFAVIKSLSLQAAGIATAVVVENYPYKKILEPGLTAIDGAIAHFYQQEHHFKIDDLHLPEDVLRLVRSASLTDTRFRLLKPEGDAYESGGIITSFGWLRRYEKNRTRANQVYERLLCRKFTATLPRVFPQDPGNLRTAPGCSGCHSTLDPMADFFKAWGEGGNLYQGQTQAVDSSFAGQSGRDIADLANIIREDSAFAACTVHHVWEWLMGRKFYEDEDTLRSKLTDYFIGTSYSFKELVYAIATHPAFLNPDRSDGVVQAPLEDPPLGKRPGEVDQTCERTYTFADLQPYLKLCTGCHNAGTAPRANLSLESEWRLFGNTSITMMKTGQMPQGSPNTPDVQKLIHAAKCWAETR